MERPGTRKKYCITLNSLLAVRVCIIFSFRERTQGDSVWHKHLTLAGVVVMGITLTLKSHRTGRKAVSFGRPQGLLSSSSDCMQGARSGNSSRPRYPIGSGRSHPH